MKILFDNILHFTNNKKKKKKKKKENSFLNK